MRQQNSQWAKFMPWLFSLIIIATMVVGVVWITSQPEVIRAKGDWANAAANLFQAKQTYHQQLPEILNRATILAVAGFLSFAALAFVLSVSINLVIHNVDRVVGHGWEFEKNVGGQKTTYKLFHTNPAPQRLPGGKPQIAVEKPGPQGFLEKNQGQALPHGDVAIPTGRPLKPEERRAPGKNPLHNTGPQPIPQGLTSGIQPNLSKDDPLAILDEPLI